MKSAILAAATLIAATSAGLAVERTAINHPAPAICIDASTKTKLDCGKTGSIEMPATAVPAVSKTRKLGIDASPWVMPSTY